jgi:hypothetical protein
MKTERMRKKSSWKGEKRTGAVKTRGPQLGVSWGGGGGGRWKGEGAPWTPARPLNRVLWFFYAGVFSLFSTAAWP